MRNIALPVVLIACLFVAMWQLTTRAKQEWSNKKSEKTELRTAGLQCPALYGVPGVEASDLPGSVKHCSCEIGAMLVQTDGTVRCSYCGKQEK